MNSDTFKKIESWDKAEQQDIRYYQSLTPERRFEMALKLIRRAYGPEANWTDIKSTPPTKISNHESHDAPVR